MINILLGISLTLNLLIGLAIFLIFKYKNKIISKIFDPMDMNSFINDDDNFLDRM